MSALHRTLVATALWAMAFGAVAAPREAVVLQPAPPTRVTAAQLASLCAALSTPCEPVETKAYVARGQGDGPMWLIDASRPMLVVLDAADPLRGNRATVWDFSEQPHTQEPRADGGKPPPLEIHPALYPVGDRGFAIALVSEVREMYSGGGASFRTADFVMLDTARTVAYGAVPFSCSKMVRACFSERDYARGHCHDENSGALTIRYPDGEGRWTFQWRETEWPAFKPKSRETTERTTFQVAPGNTERPASVGFCGGPM
ncbi:hypothetical protein [Piscinibacter gummiphilus]|uniref:hypothetical protein n=1 Tax=Piscinibacter gummiphilus TaxID=946333 RepID=UPI0012FD46FD|nr:hypothetical protein [Piscinibacter gummiphilus]